MSYVTLEVSKIQDTESNTYHHHQATPLLMFDSSKTSASLQNYLGCGQSATLPCAHFVYSRHGAVPVFADVASSNVNDDTNK